MMTKVHFDPISAEKFSDAYEEHICAVGCLSTLVTRIVLCCLDVMNASRVRVGRYYMVVKTVIVMIDPKPEIWVWR